MIVRLYHHLILDRAVYVAAVNLVMLMTASNLRMLILLFCHRLCPVNLITVSFSPLGVKLYVRLNPVMQTCVALFFCFFYSIAFGLLITDYTLIFARESLLRAVCHLIG